MRNNKLNLAKYLDRAVLIEICKKVCVRVRDRIDFNYHKKGLQVPENFTGECNRAALLFDIYFYEELQKMHMENMKQATFGDQHDYAGVLLIKCNFDLVNMHNVEVLERVNLYDVAGIQIEFIHGEQKHTTKLKPEYWGIEHTWLKVTMGKIVIYADPTCGQFKWLYKDIPDWYVSARRPKWFFPDIENPEFNKKL